MEPRLIATAPVPNSEEEPPVLMLFCPQQGGWHSGVWWRGAWRLSFDARTELFPSHWLPSLPPVAIPSNSVQHLAWQLAKTQTAPGASRLDHGGST
jgi:hypothetical protein